RDRASHGPRVGVPHRRGPLPRAHRARGQRRRRLQLGLVPDRDVLPALPGFDRRPLRGGVPARALRREPRPREGHARVGAAPDGLPDRDRSPADGERRRRAARRARRLGARLPRPGRQRIPPRPAPLPARDRALRRGARDGPARGRRARMTSRAASLAPDVAGLRTRALARGLGGDTLFGAALALAAAFVNLAPVKDPDLGWHLAAGRRVLDGLGVPWTDPFSYVAAGRPWIAYSWLPETIFAFVERAWGLPALVVLAAALAAATTVVVWRTCVATGARPAVALGAALAAMLLSAPAWNVRPHLVSFLCLALTNHVLVLARRGRDRTWWLVPVMLLWANSHILFPLGLVLVAIHAGAEAWAPRVGGARLSRRPAAGGTALVATTLATPYGWHLWRHVVVMMCQPVAF